MDLAIPLDKMTTIEKLRAMEEIWDDLRRTAEDIPSPSWHADVLEAREKRIQDGSSEFTDWPDAKRSIRDGAK